MMVELDKSFRWVRKTCINSYTISYYATHTFSSICKTLFNLNTFVLVLYLDFCCLFVAGWMVHLLYIRHGIKMNQILPTMMRTVWPFTRIWVSTPHQKCSFGSMWVCRQCTLHHFHALKQGYPNLLLANFLQSWLQLDPTHLPGIF